MITREALTVAGFRAFPVPVTEHGASAFLQRTVRLNGDETRNYFINAFLWEADGRESWELKTEFYRGEDFWFTVKLHDDRARSVSDAEAFFCDVYERLGCVPDVHNN